MHMHIYMRQRRVPSRTHRDTKKTDAPANRTQTYATAKFHMRKQSCFLSILLYSRIFISRSISNLKNAINKFQHTCVQSILLRKQTDVYRYTCGREAARISQWCIFARKKPSETNLKSVFFSMSSTFTLKYVIKTRVRTFTLAGSTSSTYRKSTTIVMHCPSPKYIILRWGPADFDPTTYGETCLGDDARHWRNREGCVLETSHSKVEKRPGGLPLQNTAVSRGSR